MTCIARLIPFPTEVYVPACGDSRLAAMQPLKRLRGGPELIAVLVIFRHHCSSLLRDSYAQEKEDLQTDKKLPCRSMGALSCSYAIA
ncbi:MAG: hypothetical protein ACLR4Z_02430 [Butyricicoccaceae bacterium]